MVETATNEIEAPEDRYLSYAKKLIEHSERLGSNYSYGEALVLSLAQKLQQVSFEPTPDDVKERIKNSKRSLTKHVLDESAYDIVGQKGYVAIWDNIQKINRWSKDKKLGWQMTEDFKTLLQSIKEDTYRGLEAESLLNVLKSGESSDLKRDIYESLMSIFKISKELGVEPSAEAKELMRLKYKVVEEKFLDFAQTHFKHKPKEGEDLRIFAFDLYESGFRGYRREYGPRAK